MNKSCARCEKTVYPIEELKCLDKVWHKGCFKCQECSMTLSMKTYKGFDKLPYCESHIPKAKATSVAETPEMKRLAENTKIQSNAIYHKDFEKNKAKFTQVADDPETIRIQKNSKIISNITYHGNLEKKALMEKKRSKPTIENDFKRLDVAGEPPQSIVQVEVPPPVSNPTPAPSQQAIHHRKQQMPHHSAPISKYNSQNYYQPQSSPASTSYQQNAYQDPNHNSPYSTGRNSQTLVYSSQPGSGQQQSKKIGSIADYDPFNEQYGSISHQKRMQQQQLSLGYQQEATYQGQRNSLLPENIHKPQQMQNLQAMQHKVNAPPTHLGRCFRAIYDYQAADTDEVSFRDGDLLINCTSIDEGWMMGTVQRTGHAGMLPANYVQRVN